MWCEETWKNDYPCITVWISVAKLGKGRVATCNYTVIIDFLSYFNTIKVFSPGFCLLAWGVPGTPLLRNRGPVRTLGGQSTKNH